MRKRTIKGLGRKWEERLLGAEIKNDVFASMEPDNVCLE